MIEKYSFLKPFMWQTYRGRAVQIWKNNIFYEADNEEIIQAEKKIGEKFPLELREFYQAIGYGYLTTPFNAPKDYKFYSKNEILPPHIAVDYMQGILEHPEEEYYMAESTFELLSPGDLPFFEIGDSSSFMVMKLNSDNPNAVWSDCGVKIESSFERFIWRLYYEDPAFYGPIIEAAYA